MKNKVAFKLDLSWSFPVCESYTFTVNTAVRN